MLCQPYYSDGVGRPSVPPGRYFRMLFVGQFEGLDSEREIAWRCAEFLVAAPLPAPVGWRDGVQPTLVQK